MGWERRAPITGALRPGPQALYLRSPLLTARGAFPAPLGDSGGRGALSTGHVLGEEGLVRPGRRWLDALCTF